MKEATKYQNVDNLWKLNIVFREYLALGVVLDERIFITSRPSTISRSYGVNKDAKAQRRQGSDCSHE